MVRSTNIQWTPRSSHVVIYLLTLIGLLLRITNIQTLEPFIDESGNVLVATDPLFSSIVDPIGQGRPLLAWLFKPALWFANVLGPDWFIWSARYQTAIIGTFTAALVSILTFSTLGAPAALCASAIVNTQPLFIIHDRLALQDPYTSFFIVCALFFGRAAVLNHYGFSWKGLFMHGGLGVTLGLAFANKISAIGPLAWFPCVVWALTEAPARLVVRRLFPGGIIAVACVLLLTPQPWLLGSNLLRSHHAPWHIPLASHFSLVSPSLVERALFVFRGLDLFMSMLLQLTSLGFVVVFLSALVLGRSRRELLPWRIGLLILLVFNTIAYHSTGFGRYFHVDGIFVSLFIAAMLRSYLTQRAPSVERRVPTPLLCGAITLCATLSGALQTVEAVRVPTAEHVLRNTDYYLYTRSGESGYGIRDFSAALSSYLAVRPNTELLFAPPAFSPLTNMLLARQLLQSDISVRIGDFESVWFPAIALHYLRARVEERSTFLVAHSHPLRSSEALSRTGIACTTVHSTPRLCSECTFELLECRLSDASQILQNLPIQDGPRSDGYVGPRLRVTRPVGKSTLCLTISVPPECGNAPLQLSVHTSTRSVPLQEVSVESDRSRRCATLDDVEHGDLEIVSDRWTVVIERPGQPRLWGGSPFVASYRLHSIDFNHPPSAPLAL